MKLLILIILSLFALTAHCQSETVKDPLERIFKEGVNSLYAQEPGYFETLRLQFFGAQRDAWNGIINGFNDWKDYKLKTSCMGNKYQDQFIAGTMKFFFKLLTGQYMNVLQIFYDASTAYQFVLAELNSCYGKQVIAAYEEFWLRAPIHLAVASTVMFVVNQGVLIVPRLFFLLHNTLLWDFYNANVIIGRFFRGMYDEYKNIDF